METTLFILCVIGPLLRPVLGTGSLYDPPSRPVMWKYGYETEKNYNYMQLNCGGEKQPQNGPKQCGVCGDYVNGTRDHELGGIYGAGVIGRYYPSGIKEIQVNVELLAFEEGFFEFRLCPANDRPVTQACLDEYLLPIKQGYLTGTPFRFYPKSAGDYRLIIAVPPKMTCDRCVLQWRYHTGNSWGTDPKTREEGKGFGPQEEFYNCADIRIGGVIPASVLSNPFFAPPDGSSNSVSTITGEVSSPVASITPLKPTVVDHTNPGKATNLMETSGTGSNVPVATLTIDTTANAEWLSKIESGPRAFNTGTSRIDVTIPALSEVAGGTNVQSSLNSGASSAVGRESLGVLTGTDTRASLTIQTGETSSTGETLLNTVVDGASMADLGTMPDIQPNLVNDPMVTTGVHRTAKININQPGGMRDQSMDMVRSDQAPQNVNVNIGALDLTNTFDTGASREINAGFDSSGGMVEKVHTSLGITHGEGSAVTIGSSGNSLGSGIHTDIGASGGMMETGHNSMGIQMGDQTVHLGSTKAVISSSRTNEQIVPNGIAGNTFSEQNVAFNTQSDQVPADINVGIGNTISDMTLEPASVDLLMGVDSNRQDGVANIVQPLPTGITTSGQNAMVTIGVENTVSVDTGLLADQPVMDFSMNAGREAAIDTLGTMNVITTTPDASFNIAADTSNVGIRVEQPFVDPAPTEPSATVNVGLIQGSTMGETTNADPVNIVIKSDFGNTAGVVDRTGVSNVGVTVDQPFVDSTPSDASASVNVDVVRDLTRSTITADGIINIPADITTAPNTATSDIGIVVDRPYVEALPTGTANTGLVNNGIMTSSQSDMGTKSNLGSVGVQSFVETLSNGGVRRMTVDTDGNRLNAGMEQITSIDTLTNTDPPEIMPPIFVPPAVGQPVVDVIVPSNIGDVSTAFAAVENTPANNQAFADRGFSNIALQDGGSVAFDVNLSDPQRDTIITPTDLPDNVGGVPIASAAVEIAPVTSAINDQAVTDRVVFSNTALQEGGSVAFGVNVNDPQRNTIMTPTDLPGNAGGVPIASAAMETTPVTNAINDQAVTDRGFSMTTLQDGGSVAFNVNLNDPQRDTIITPTDFPGNAGGVPIASAAVEIAPVTNAINDQAATDREVFSNTALQDGGSVAIDVNLNGPQRDTIITPTINDRNVADASVTNTNTLSRVAATIDRIIENSIAMISNNNVATVDPVSSAGGISVIADTDTVAGGTNRNSVATIDITSSPVDSSINLNSNVNIEPLVFNTVKTVSAESVNNVPRTDITVDRTITMPPKTNSLGTSSDAMENIVLSTNLRIEVPAQPQASLVKTGATVVQPRINLNSSPGDVPAIVSFNDGTQRNVAGQTGDTVRITKTTTTEMRPAGGAAINNVVPSQPRESGVNYTVTVTRGTGGSTEDISTFMKDVQATKERMNQKFSSKANTGNQMAASPDKPSEIQSQINNFNLNTIPNENTMDTNIEVGPNGVLRPGFGPRIDRTTRFRNLNRSPITDNIGSNTADLGGRRVRPASSSDVPEGLIPGGNVRIVVDPRTGSEVRSSNGVRVLSSSRTREQRPPIGNEVLRRGSSTTARGTSRVNTVNRVTGTSNGGPVSGTSRAQSRTQTNRDGGVSRTTGSVASSSSSSMSSGSSRPDTRPSSNGGRIVRITTIRGRRPASTGGSRTVASSGNGGRSDGMAGARRGDFRSRVFTTDRRRMETPRFDPRFGRPITTGPVGATGFRPMVGGGGRPVGAGIAAGGGFSGMPRFGPGGDLRFTGAPFDGRTGGFGPIRGFPMLPGGGPFPMGGFPGSSPILAPSLGTGTFDPFMGGTLTPAGFMGF